MLQNIICSCVVNQSYSLVSSAKTLATSINYACQVENSLLRQHNCDPVRENKAYVHKEFDHIFGFQTCK